MSNAKNDPNLKLSLGFTIRSELGVEPSYLSIRPGAKGTVHQSLTLTTQKKNLEIKEVSFKESTRPGKGMNAWQADLSIPFNFKLEPTDKKLDDDYIEYKLDISTTVPEDHKTSYGNFIILTNHPKKKEIEVRGVIMEPQK
jgi:hypothetical protein